TAVGQEPAQVGDEQFVDVQAAQVVQAADRDGPPVPVVGAAPEDGDVEGAAAEVEDGDGAAFGELLAEFPGAVGGGRDRFGQELVLAEAGVGGGPLQGRAARRSPVGRVGDGDFGGPQ